MSPEFAAADDIREAFAATMSAMYRAEVPAYGFLIDLVARVNDEALVAQPDLERELDRISLERHGAIRLGTAAELAMMRRVFAVMGMHPVGYYDLSAAGVPVHATAFRPVGAEALRRNPFRVFTSLLRLDLIADRELREAAARLLAARRIFSEGAIELTERAERQGGLSPAEAERFVAEVVETFRWHDRANVDADLYRRLHDAHRLVADVVSFKGPHINHLTPRTLDIDRAHSLMSEYGLAPKAVIEGPPARKCPILLRQTSFKALEEPVCFRDGAGGWREGAHTARFGEIEQRGIALTRKGRLLYDLLLAQARAEPGAYPDALERVFAAFPDGWDEIRKAGLGFFTYSLTEKGRGALIQGFPSLDQLIADGLIRFDPIIYEDFLPVSAAGIFQSNLGDGARQPFAAGPNRQRFEADLGAEVLDEFDHYAAIEQDSLRACVAALVTCSAAE
jgi:uncharacterized glyoxalase superfamily metalloenzyme YdcJ